MTIKYETAIWCESCPEWMFLVVTNFPPSKRGLRRQAAGADWGYEEGSDFCPKCMEERKGE